jgi:hypothetical protein
LRKSRQRNIDKRAYSRAFSERIFRAGKSLVKPDNIIALGL